VTSTDTKQAEKQYLSRSGSLSWEIAKPFSPPGAEMLAHGADLLHDFSVAMLLLRPAPNDLILDLGAGACWCSDLLGRLNRASIAVDISHEMLRVGRSRPGSAIRATTGDMESLPFRSGVFAKSICLSAIHHVPNIGAALKEVARVLTADGVALFSEPGKGHADADVSATAMREYGVLEQDILIEDFVEKCRDAGFEDVRVMPLAYAVPGYDLSLEQWLAWSRLAASTRPRRALEKIALGCAEIFGFGKRGRLFEDTFAISIVRTLRPLIERHPIIVASKRAQA
jgi:SAM-dependent methyltransferase